MKKNNIMRKLKENLIAFCFIIPVVIFIGLFSFTYFCKPTINKYGTEVNTYTVKTSTQNKLNGSKKYTASFKKGENTEPFTIENDKPFNYNFNDTTEIADTTYTIYILWPSYITLHDFQYEHQTIKDIKQSDIDTIKSNTLSALIILFIFIEGGCALYCTRTPKNENIENIENNEEIKEKGEKKE